MLLPGDGRTQRTEHPQLAKQILLIDRRSCGAQGWGERRLLNLGGTSGGFAFYLKDGGPAFCYNLFGIEWTHIRSDQAVPEGDHQVRVEFAYDGDGMGKGGDVRLYTDGVQVGEGRVERTEPIGFGYEYTDVGVDELSPVTDDYPAGKANAFTGSIKWIELSVDRLQTVHEIDAEDFIRMAFARQ